MLRKAIPKSIPWLLRAHSAEPGNPEIAYALTEQLLQLQYVDTAAKILQQAAALQPSHALLMVAEGDVQQARGGHRRPLIPTRALARQTALVLRWSPSRRPTSNKETTPSSLGP